MTRTSLICGLAIIGALMGPGLSANAATPKVQLDVFSFSYTTQTLAETKGKRSFERSLKRAARNYCSVGTAPGMRRAIRRCENAVVSQVVAQLAHRTRIAPV